MREKKKRILHFITYVFNFGKRKSKNDRMKEEVGLND